jgi:hypothetical protein
VSQYRVTLIGEAREVMIVQADSAEEAAATWDVNGWSESVTCYGMDVDSIEEDDQ